MTNLSRKKHIAKRDLRTLCDNCHRKIKKAEKYYIHTHNILGRWVEHIKCPEKQNSEGSQ